MKFWTRKIDRVNFVAVKGRLVCSTQRSGSQWIIKHLKRSRYRQSVIGGGDGGKLFRTTPAGKTPAASATTNFKKISASAMCTSTWFLEPDLVNGAQNMAFLLSSKAWKVAKPHLVLVSFFMMLSCDASEENEWCLMLIHNYFDMRTAIQRTDGGPLVSVAD